MSDTQKDRDFRKLRKAGKSIWNLFGSKTVRKRLNASRNISEDGERIINTYTQKELYTMAHRRHSAAHRHSAMKMRHRLNRQTKHRENRDAMKEHLDAQD